jgi:iron complex outermembrane receptor protein
MSRISRLLLVAACAFPALFAAAAFGQAEHAQTWAQDIALLEQMTPAQAAAQQQTILQIRSDVTAWIAAHPGTSVKLAPAPQPPVTAGQAAAELKDLAVAVHSIQGVDPTHPFHLGMTEVVVSSTLSALSPTAQSIAQKEIELHNATNDARAIDLTPGIEIANTVGRRNEAVFNLRGFSSQGRVPLYLDGIPIYVPYDGDLDLNRFLSSDVAEIEIAKGFSSPLLGPGALGGSVNIVSKEPTRSFEGQAAMGTYSGNGLLSSLRLATKQKSFFAQATLDWLQNDFVPLSGNFSYPTGGYTYLQTGKYNCYPSSSTTNCNVPYPLTNQENNSNSRDEKWAGRIGWTPRTADEYVFSYTNQKGQKGVPLYMGPDAAYSFNKGSGAAFWLWPYWNKDSYYFLSNTGLGQESAIKFRAFYDQFRNSIDMYDNNQYDSMLSYSFSSASASASGSEVSQYNDHADGASTEFTTRLIKNNLLGGSFFFKDDSHKELGIYPGAASYTTTGNLSAEYNPVKELRSQQESLGLLDQITFTQRLHATIGFSADHIGGLKQDTYTASKSGSVVTVSLVPFTCASNTTNTSYSGCMLHAWTVNPQASFTYVASGSDLVFVTYEDRGDFPTMKQLYSASMGSGMPNPSLQSEHSQNWNFGYTHNFGNKTSATAELFRSDLRNAIESEYILDPDWNQTTDPKDLLGLCPNDTKYTGYCSYYLNVGKETHEGVELAVHSRPVSRLVVDGNYSYLNRTIASANVPANVLTSYLNSGIYLPYGIPKNKAIGTAAVQLPFNIEGMVSERYEGGITLQTDSNLGSLNYKSAFATTDLAMNVTLNKRFLGVEIPEGKLITAQAGIKNVFDRNYFLTDGFPEAGRNWFVNVRYHF